MVRRNRSGGGLTPWRQHTTPLLEWSPPLQQEAWRAGGEPFPGAGFRRDDEVWDLAFRETRAATSSRVSFQGFPEWFKPVVKDYVEYLWQVRALSLGTIVNARTCLLKLAGYVAQFRPELCDIRHLTTADVTGFMRSVQTGQSSTARALSPFLGWLRTWATEGPAQDILFAPGDYQPRRKPATFINGMDKVVPREVRVQLLWALQQEEPQLRERLGQEAAHEHGDTRAFRHLVVCQIIKLLMLSGRRLSHICRLKRSPLPLQEPKPGEARGVWLVWDETKFKQGLRPVFIPTVEDGDCAAIAREAVHTAMTLTADLVQVAKPIHRHLLFLVYTPARGREASVRPVHRNDVHWYVNGRWAHGALVSPGLIQRYNIRHHGELYPIKFHGFRHARATELHEGGAGLGTIQQDLVHSSRRMAGVYTHGLAPVVADLWQLKDQGALRGIALPLIQDKWVQIARVSEQDMTLWRDQGMFVQPTRYGFCVLPVEAGPCPSGDPCWIGPKGDGCVYHLYGPAIRQPLEEDIHDLRWQLADRERRQPQSPLLGHLCAILTRYEQVLAELAMVPTSGGACGQPTGD